MGRNRAVVAVIVQINSGFPQQTLARMMPEFQLVFRGISAGPETAALCRIGK